MQRVGLHAEQLHESAHVLRELTLDVQELLEVQRQDRTGYYVPPNKVMPSAMSQADFAVLVS